MSKLQKAQTQQGHSKHFFEFIRTIGEAKTKQEEDKIISRDVVDLKRQMADKSTSNKIMKEYVVRMVYCEMLGHSAEFGHIHAVNLASSTDLVQKRTGYLATWLSVNPEHEFMYLIVANVQRDMKSISFLDVAAALTAAHKLIKPELMSALNDQIVALSEHTNPMVRKKATLVMQSFYKRSDGLIGEQKVWRTALCDRDPSVMGAALSLFQDVIDADPQACRDLLPSFLSILKQITEHRLARDYEYHRVPAPWMQIRLLKLIAVLGADDQAVAQRCAETITETLKRADTGLNIGHAIIHECINTITSFHPVPELIEVAAEYISKFLTAQSSNLKYLGITALSRIVKIDPKYAQEHQHIVIDCLEDPDDTIRRKTISLLFAMCNEDNIEPISARLIKFLAGATDKFLRRDLVVNICDVADRFSAGNDWYISTMNKVIELAPEHVSPNILQGMLKMIAEGDGEDEAEDAQFRTQCVEDYFALMENPDKVLPPALFQLASWVIGEYGFLTRKISRSMMIDRLCDMLDRQSDVDAKGWIITALMKLSAHGGAIPDNVEEMVAKHVNSRSVSLQQRAYEFMALSKMLPLMKKALPLDGCCEEIDVDEKLSFLDVFVEEALAKGARPYQKKEVALGPEDGPAIKTDAYKLAASDQVDVDDLDKDKFNDENPDRLIIKESARKWGAKNLEGEAAVDGSSAVAVTTEDTEAKPAEHPSGDGSSTAQHHADPLADQPRKQTKNEKFFNDIFSGTSGSKKRPGGKRGSAARAREAQKRAEEADQHHASGTGGDDAAASSLTSGRPETPPAAQPKPSKPATAAAAAATSSAPGPSSSTSAAAAKVEFNFQRNLIADACLIRVGILCNSAPLERVTINFAAPPRTQFDVQPVEGLKANSPTQILCPGIPQGKPLFLVTRLRASDYPQGGALQVSVTFTANGAQGSAQGGTSLMLSDLCRPDAAMTTEQFGKQWVALAEHEAKVVMKFPGAISPEVLAKYIGEKAGLRIIQVIKREAIACTRVIPVGHLVLAMMSVDGATVSLAVRCANKDFGGAVANFLAANTPK